MPLQWQTLNVPFTSGLGQRSDERARNPPTLDIADDLQFDELGGVQTRKPFAAVGLALQAGGTIDPTTIVKLLEHNGERLMFTTDALYSFDAGAAVWVPKGTHLAAQVSEQTRFSTSGDQFDCDRAELAGVALYIWADTDNFNVSHVSAAAVDVTTGDIIVSPSFIQPVSSRPRLVALQAKFLLFGFNTATSSLEVHALSPATIAADILALATGTSPAGTTVLASPNFGQYYDVAPLFSPADAAIVVCRRATTSSYSIIQVTSALVVTASTKARTCVGPIAVSPSPSGTTVQVIRAESTTVITGDLITLAGLADSIINQFVGTSANEAQQIAACHRSTQDAGAYRCYAFWDEGAIPQSTQANWVDDAGNLGTAHGFIGTVCIASRAFTYLGRVYVWTVFDEATSSLTLGRQYLLQDTYFLYRDDGFLVGQAALDVAGGRRQSNGLLPAVPTPATGTRFTFLGGYHRAIPITGGGKTYAMRSPREVAVQFNASRRCISLGETLYIAGSGELLQYDGVQISEVGFHIYPWTFFAVAAGSGGHLYAGTYAWKFNFRWQNATGEVEQSTTATVQTLTVVANDSVQFGAIGALDITHKATTGVASSGVEVQCWRTEVNPDLTSPFYRVTSNDPGDTSNPNRYLPNDPTSTLLPLFVDDLSDVDLGVRETFYENGSVLSNLGPPPATIIAANQDRLFLAGITGDPDRVWYSKLRNVGEVAAFNDALTFAVPRAGGDITAIGFTADGVLVVWRERAIYAFGGAGFDNAGGGQNFGLSRTIASDVGCASAEAIAYTEKGHLFKTARGWYLLPPELQPTYIGAAVYGYDAAAVLAVTPVPAQHQVRVATDEGTLVWDYLINEWAHWTIVGEDSCLWGGQHVLLDATEGPMLEQPDFSGGVTYGLDVETAWIKAADLQGFSRVRYIYLLGEFRSACAVRMRVARDYLKDGSGNPLWFDDFSWNVTPAVIGGPLQLRHGPSQQQVESIKIRITAVAAGVAALLNFPLEGEANNATFTALAPGTAGNAITVQLIGDLSSGITYAEASGAITIHYAPGVTTVAQLLAAVAASSTLASLTTSVTTTHTIAGDNAFGPTHLAGGTDAGASSPTSEAIKLTGLALEVGVKSGTYKRLPAAQKP